MKSRAAPQRKQPRGRETRRRLLAPVSRPTPDPVPKGERQMEREAALLSAVLDDRPQGEADAVPAAIHRLSEAWQRYRCHVPREAARRLFLHVREYAPRLLHNLWGRGPEDHVEALFRLASQDQHWLRPAQGWRPRSREPAEQFGELARYLYAVYPVPRFMDAVFSGPGPLGHASWFPHLGVGQSIRTAPGMYAALTKRMVHHFLRAPDGRTPVEAIRWGQVMGLGGSHSLFHAVVNTWMGRELRAPADEEWWLTVLQWLAAHPEIEPDLVGPVIDYVEARAREEDGSFTLRGRSAAALLRLVEEWHGGLGMEYQGSMVYRKFRPCGVPGAVWPSPQETEGETWVLEELLNSRQLCHESRVMRHCVASYASYVASGQVAIWSLRRIRGERVQRVLTVELDLSRRAVVQARGPCNRLPEAEERGYLELWTAENGLRLAC